MTVTDSDNRALGSPRVGHGSGRGPGGGAEAEREAGERDRETVPQRCSPEHRVLTGAYLNRRDAGQRAGPFGIDPGVRRPGDGVRGAVREQDAAAAGLAPWLPPGEPARTDARPRAARRVLPSSARPG